MAIINCPECEEKISDTAAQCIHCGAKITVCPECKKVYAGETKNCSECGYVFKESKTEEAPAQNHLKTSKDVVDQWEREKPYVKYIFSGIVGHIIDFIPFLFLIFAIVKLMQWDNFLSSAETFESIKTLIIFSAIFYSVYSVYDAFASHCKEKLLSSWCMSNKINLKDSIRTTLQTDFDSMSVECGLTELTPCILCLHATMSYNGTSENSKINRIIVTNIILGIARAILLAVFLIKNIEIYMVAKMFETEASGGWEVSMVEDWWLLIATAATAIVWYLLVKLAEKTKRSACVNYIHQNLPECNNVCDELFPD